MKSDEQSEKWPTRLRGTIKIGTKRIGYLLASSAFFLSSQVAVAGRFNRKQTNDNTATITKIDQKEKKNNKKVVIEVVNDEDEDYEGYEDGEYTIVDIILDNIYSITDEQWNKLGVGAAVVSLVYSLVKKDDYKEGKRSRRRKNSNSYSGLNENVARRTKKTTPKIAVMDEDDEVIEEATTKTFSASKNINDEELFDESALKSSTNSLGRMKKKAFNMPDNADDLFSEGESVDDVFIVKDNKSTTVDNEIARDVVTATEKKEPAFNEEKRETKKNKGIFDRIFSKPGGNRETDLEVVLAASDDTSEFRTRVAVALLSYIPAMGGSFT